ncbi:MULTISPECIES: nucleotidyltransferase family protein [unclassified Roseofilum]|uniref:nucleotidyltransferase family protein n=1 Tax=unclassified Roseofilum TaxID=2620099 RepID=UPI000E91852A|nr:MULTISPECIES: nucleotidyltransferase family protein [unclassified Roseofilum]MBP0008538.1 nucleotidyltransferase family protein [Roseofilum sp. Belize Diploria]MBP0033797.1 nucleotidyltransferase family protein [Roseofilum sp. Belize BBD 4]HBQ98648.1 nucleotidyltransferase [Cyanobacteria bacterium UBA11691]
MKTLPIALQYSKVVQFCQKYHIRKLALFGSVLRDDFTEQSDVDVLVEFLSGKTPGLAIVTMADKLTTLLGRVVDLRTPGDLSCYFRDAVLTGGDTYFMTKTVFNDS